MSLSSIGGIARFDTALLPNTIGSIDPTPPQEFYMGGPIRSLTPTLEPPVGVAFTCELDSSTPLPQSDTGEYHQQNVGFYPQVDAISAIEEPAVWVVKTLGSRPDDECVLGYGMAKTRYGPGASAS